MVGDLAVANAHHVDGLKVNFAVSWSDAEEISFMCSVVCLVRDHPVAIGKLPMDLWVKVGKCVAHIAVELAHTGFVGRHVWLRRVVDEIVREQLFKNVEPSFALDLFGIATYHGFACVRCCQGSHTRKLFECVVLRERLAGFILANSTLSHVLSPAMPAKKTANARRVGERSGKRVAGNTMHEMRYHVSQKHSRKEAKEVVIPAHEACF